MIFKFLSLYFIFTSNNDVQDLFIFGHSIETWLIYVLIFFGLTSLAFVSVWFIGFLVESQSGKSIKQPWEWFFLKFLSFEKFFNYHWLFKLEIVSDSSLYSFKRSKNSLKEIFIWEELEKLFWLIQEV